MIDKKKILIGIVGAVIAIIVIVGIIIIIPKGGKKFEKTVFIDTNNRLTIEGKTIHGYFDDIKVKKQNVKVYYDGKIIDGYVVTEEEPAEGVDNALTVYSASGELLDVDKLVFSYTPDIKPDIIGVYFEDIESLREVMRLIVNSKIDVDITSVKNDYCIGSAFDFDGDAEPEYVYSMGLKYENSKYISAVMMEKNHKFYIIDVLKSDDGLDRSLSLYTIADFNNDGKYEFVIQNDSTENGYTFFNFDGTTFNKLNLY